jgi:hypothetical protein
MQSLSLKQSLPAHLSLTLRDPSHWLPSSLDSSLVHVLPDDVARLTRQELDFIFSNGPGTPPSALFMPLDRTCLQLHPHTPPNRRVDLAFLNVPPARRVRPPPLPDVPCPLSLRSPPPFLRSKFANACRQQGPSSSTSGSSSRNSSNVSSCSLDDMPSSDDDIWGCNGRCKVWRSHVHASTAAHRAARRCAAQAVAVPGPAPRGVTCSARSTLRPAPPQRHSRSSGGGGAAR